MSEQATFYRLKYPTLPDAAQIEELKKNEFGSFVLFTLASSVLGETNEADKKYLMRRIEKDPFGEMSEFFNDLSQPTRTDIGSLKNSTLNEFVKLMVLADEMQNG